MEEHDAHNVVGVRSNRIPATKVCSDCGKTKLLAEFGKRTASTDGRHRYCKPCYKVRMRTYNLSYYSDPVVKARHVRDVREDKQRRLIALRAYVNTLKSAPCTDCGQSFDPVCMDFDHLGEDKTDIISNMVVRLRPLEMILNEISKCELVCSNCHRLRTKRRRVKGL